MRNGTIFLTGGGTMNDDSADRARLKTKVVDMFKYNPVVIMPDIINYGKSDPNLLADQIEAFNLHEKLTLLLQDQGSIDFAKKHFTTANVMYVPDTTWMIGPTFPNSQPYIDILLLFRRDTKEHNRTAISSHYLARLKNKVYTLKLGIFLLRDTRYTRTARDSFGITIREYSRID